MFDWGYFLHKLVVYTIAGSVIGWGVFLLAKHALKISDPVKLKNLLLLILVTPILTGLYSFFLLPILTEQSGPQCANSFFEILCPLGNLGSNYYLPILLLIPFALYRSLMFCGYHRKISNWTIKTQDDCYRRPNDILNSLVHKAEMPMPKIRIVDKPVNSCFTYSFPRPTIVISRDLLMQLSDDELKMVLAHELGHIHYRDGFWRGMGTVLRVSGFYIPFTYYIYNALLNEQELAADDFAIKLTGKPLVYGATLIKVWRNNQGNERFLPVSAFANSVKVSDRVQRVINDDKNEGFVGKPCLLPVLGLTIIMLLSYAC